MILSYIVTIVFQPDANTSIGVAPVSKNRIICEMIDKAKESSNEKSISNSSRLQR